MTQKKKDTGTPNPGRNDSGVGYQYDPHYSLGSEQDTKPGDSKINNPSKETKDETEKSELKDGDSED
ncbi:MAG TPA: hypothetical protein VHM26_15455 [Chitinophagaceae bacterium]|jgi:hypothetical protein|nr:hypothetical protein [Chitinophagaceae bacterium]